MNRTATSASTSRRPRASASAGSTIRSTSRCAATPDDGHLRPVRRSVRRRNAVELRSGRQIFEAPRHDLQRRRFPHQDQGSAGHARRGQLLVAHRVQRAQGAYHRRRGGVRRCRPLTGLDLSLAGSYVEAEFDTRPLHPVRCAVSAPASAKAIACRSVPKFQMAATATYGQRFTRQATGMSRPASSMSAAATRSRRTRSSIRGPSSPTAIPTSAAFRSPAWHDRRSRSCRPIIWSISRPGSSSTDGLDLILYANNHLRREPATVVRPRTWRAGAPWLQHRPAAHDRADHSPRLQRRAAGRARRR